MLGSFVRGSNSLGCRLTRDNIADKIRSFIFRMFLINVVSKLSLSRQCLFCQSPDKAVDSTFHKTLLGP